MLKFLISSLTNPLNIIFLIVMGYLYFKPFFKEMAKFKETEEDIDQLLVHLNESDEEGKLNSKEYNVIGREVEALNKSIIERDGVFYSTIEIEQYFNSVNLLEEKLNMKKLVNIPNLFPGIGILGTFIGLAYGLSTINTGGSSNEIVKSIKPLLDNISVAFVSSILGILFSLVSTWKLNGFLGDAEEKILEVERFLNIRFPIYGKAKQGEELLKEIKEIKTTTNGLATDISNQLGEHISTQVGEKIDTLVSGSNEIMKGLTHEIGDKVERVTEILSNDFGDSLTGALDKIFTEDLVGNFKQIGTDIVTLSGENMDNLNIFKEAMSSIILDLNDIKDNYEDVNNKTSDINKEVVASLDHLTETIADRTIAVDENLEKTVGVFNSAAEQVEVLEESLSKSLKETSSTLEKLSDYMNINKEVSESMVRFMDSEEKILELWNGYDDKFTDLNTLLVEGSKGFEESLNASVSSYKTQLNGIRDEFATMMTTLNQKYSEYTNKNTMDLFKEYDHQLATAINKFGGLMSSLEEEVEGLQTIIEAQNLKIGEAIEIITPVKVAENKEDIQA